MSHLTEGEVLDKLQDSLGEAIQASKELAVRSRLGRPYERLGNALVAVEGCCRQLAAFRGDGRWLPFGIYMAECHKRAGGWIRGYRENGVHIFHTNGHINKVFVELANQLSHIQDAVMVIANAKTGTTGPILPATPPAERRIGAPVSTSGLILPASVRPN